MDATSTQYAGMVPGRPQCVYCPLLTKARTTHLPGAVSGRLERYVLTCEMPVCVCVCTQVARGAGRGRLAA